MVSIERWPLNASSSLDDPYYECLKHWTVAQWYSCSIVLVVGVVLMSCDLAAAADGGVHSAGEEP